MRASLHGLLLAAFASTVAPSAYAQRTTDTAGPVAAIERERLAAWHDMVASRPHPAGSEGDAQLIARLAETFGDMGLETDVHRFTAYISRPVRASLRVITPLAEELPVAEVPLPGSDFSADADPALRLGWNAYSGSGDVTAEVVYANYGRREDFQLLAERGVDCTGRIVVARYGGNFRGFKAKYAEEAGAAGLLIYTDPRDFGFGRGLESPEGGWATCDQIQRGSLKTLPYEGDPLTPGVEATADAVRLDPDKVALPRIPVQPIGWFAATRVLSQMGGESVPDDWQGGLPFRYRLTGGPDLTVHLVVEQERRLVETANVVARLAPPDADPDDYGVIVGCHHDAWVFGADDPTSGLIALLEAAQVLSLEAARSEEFPFARPITFAAWGAEEHGIIGSTEWVEANEDALREHAALYVNLDAAASGDKLSVAASPSLRALLFEATRAVPDPFGDGSATAFDNWRGRGADAPKVRFLGGGSDHVSFLARAAVPSVSLSASGAPGTAYHSLYDDLVWYRRVVGSDYRSAALVCAVTVALVERAARPAQLPMDLGAPPEEAQRALHVALAGVELTEEQTALVERFDALAESQATVTLAARPRATNAALRALDRAWLDPVGLPGRPWYQNLYTAPDETSGYAAWPLPGLQKARLEGSPELLTAELGRLVAVLERRGRILAGMTLPADEPGR